MLDRLKSLFRSLSIYGLGDVATSLANLAAAPRLHAISSRQEDYGVITMLLTIEAVAKVVFRWGVDTAFMRLYYDCSDQRARQRLASTIFFFLLVVNGALVAMALGISGWLSRQIFNGPEQALLVALVVGNTFVAGFYFLPYQVLRISEKSTEFISLTFARSLATLVARLILVIGAGWGVLGVVVRGRHRHRPVHAGADPVVPAVDPAGVLLGGHSRGVELRGASHSPLARPPGDELVGSLFPEQVSDR